MTPKKYRERYLLMLKKDNLTKEDEKEFNEAVEHYKIVYPNWREFER